MASEEHQLIQEIKAHHAYIANQQGALSSQAFAKMLDNQCAQLARKVNNMEGEIDQDTALAAVQLLRDGPFKDSSACLSDLAQAIDAALAKMMQTEDQDSKQNVLKWYPFYSKNDVNDIKSNIPTMLKVRLTANRMASVNLLYADSVTYKLIVSTLCFMAGLNSSAADRLGLIVELKKCIKEKRASQDHANPYIKCFPDGPGQLPDVLQKGYAQDPPSDETFDDNEILKIQKQTWVRGTARQLRPPKGEAAVAAFNPMASQLATFPANAPAGLLTVMMQMMQQMQQMQQAASDGQQDHLKGFQLCTPRQRGAKRSAEQALEEALSRLPDSQASDSQGSEETPPPKTRNSKEGPGEAAEKQLALVPASTPGTHLMGSKIYNAMFKRTQAGRNNHKDESGSDEESAEDSTSKRPAAAKAPLRMKPAAASAHGKKDKGKKEIEKKETAKDKGKDEKKVTGKDPNETALLKRKGLAMNAKTEVALNKWLKKNPGKIPSAATRQELKPGGCAKCRWAGARSNGSACSGSCWKYAYGK